MSQIPDQLSQQSQSSTGLATSPQVKRRSNGDARTLSPTSARRNESPVWKYFKKVNNETACQVERCAKTYSLNSATTCLINHLKLVHNIISVIRDDEDEDLSNEDFEKSDDKRVKIVSQNAHYAINSRKKEELDKSLLVSKNYKVNLISLFN
jgi:hypothetical protein